MKLRTLSHAVLTTSLTLIACSGSPTGPTLPNMPEVFEDFILSQNLPKLRTFEIIMQNEELEICFFRVEYGKPQDCPSGCFYSTAVGLQTRLNYIGWIRIDNYENMDTEQLKLYDIPPWYEGLFEENLWTELEATDSWVFWAAFLPLLATHSETPITALQAIATKLHTYSADWIAWDLLNNWSVQNTRPILTVLSNLPVFQGDPYNSARQRAQELLVELDAQLLLIGNYHFSLKSYLSRDFMPGQSNDSLRASIRVIEADFQAIPDSIDIVRLTIENNGILWITDFTDETPIGPPYPPYVMHRYVQNGPRWAIGTYVDVIVDILTLSGVRYQITAEDQQIWATASEASMLKQASLARITSSNR